MKKAVLREILQTDQQDNKPIMSEDSFVEQVIEQPKVKKAKAKKAVQND